MAGRDDKTVRLKVVIDEDTKGAKRAEIAVHGVRAETDKLSDSLKEGTKESGKFGDGLKDVAKDARTLDQELQDLYAERRKIIQQYDETADKSHLKERARVNSQINAIKRMKKELTEGVKDSGGALSKLGDALGGLGTMPKVAIALSPVIGVLATEVGAMLSGVLAGSTVGIGMAAGIASATRDAGVRSAARHLGDEVSKEFFSGGAVFVDPVIDSLGILEQGFKDMNIGTAFAKAAPDVETLADGIARLGKNFMPGFNRAMDHSGELTRAFADGLADTGEALGDALGDMAESKGAVGGLTAAFDLLNGAIGGIGSTLATLGDWFHYATAGQAWLTGYLEDIPLIGDVFGFDVANDEMERLSGTGEGVVDTLHVFNKETAQSRIAADLAAKGITDFADSAGYAAGEVIKLDSAAARMHNNFLKWADVEVNAEEAIDNLTASLKENGLTLDAGTEKGRSNIRALEDIAKTSAVAAQATYDETGSLQFAQMTYDSYRKQLVKTLIAAGETRKEAERLASAWLGIPGHVSTVIETTYVTRKLTGEEFREEQMAGARHRQRRAGGGPVRAGVPYTVGESGWETFVPDSNGRIVPHGQSMAMAGASGAIGARPIEIRVDGNTAMAALMRELRNEIARLGGTLAVLGLKAA